MATEALVAQVLVSKYADHLPLYRQAQIFARPFRVAVATLIPSGPDRSLCDRWHRARPLDH
jgi:transposase